MTSPPAGSLLRHLCRLLQPVGGAAPTDRQLLERFTASKDEGAFAALVDRHGGLVLGVCRRLLGDAHEAEDVFQATFLVLACKATNIRNREAVSSWLHGVAIRLARKARARRIRRRECASRETSAGEDVVGNIARDEVRQLLDEELHRLPARYRVPLVLCYLEGKSRQEVAAELGCSEGAVKGNLERGRELLRARLLRRGVAVIPAALAVESSAVPAAWTAAAVKSASSGQAVSATAAALARGLLRATTASKLKAVAGVLLLLGLATAALPLMRPNPPDPAPQVVADSDNGVLRHPRPLLFVGLAVNGRPAGPAPRGFTAFCATCHGEAVGRPAGGDEAETTVRAVLAPDGHALAAVGCDGRVRVWDMASGSVAGRLEIGAAADSPLTFSPDGKKLAISDRRQSVGLWDLSTGREVRRLRTGRADVMAFSPDGNTLAAAGIGTIRLWDVRTGEGVPCLDTLGEEYAALAFAPDGRTLATRTADGPVRLWDVTTGQEVSCLPAPESPAGTLAFTADGRFLALANRRGGACVWEVSSGRVCSAGLEVTSWASGGRKPPELELAPSGGLRPPLASLEEGAIRLRDADSGLELPQRPGPSLDLVTIALAPDGRSLRRSGIPTTALVRSVVGLRPATPP